MINPAAFKYLPQIYIVCYAFSSFLFSYAMLLTLPIFPSQQMNQFFNLIFPISSFLMILAEIAECVVLPLPKWSKGISFLSIIGFLAYFYCSIVYNQHINHGTVYILGAFSVSLACSLKILVIVIQKGKAVSQIIKLQKSKLLRFGCQALSWEFFLYSSIVLLVGNNRIYIAGGLNILAGIMSSTSVFYLLRKPPSQPQYSEFKEQTQLGPMN